MIVLREPIRIISVTKSVSFLVLVLLSSCLSDTKNESAFEGKWININIPNTDSPLIYDFKSESEIYTKYLSGQVSKRNFEITNNELLITSDTNSNYLEKYTIASQQDDSLELVDTHGYRFKLIPLKNISSQNISAVDLKRALLEDLWLMNFDDSLDQKKKTVEFFRNNKYLFSYGFGESSNAIVYSWQISRMDSLTLIVFTDFKPNLFFIDSISTGGISGNLFASDGIRKPVSFKRIEGNNHGEIENMLAGGWQAESDSISSDIPLLMEFEFEDDYRGYFMNNKDGDVLSIGSWALSKNDNIIVLDELKEGNRSIINVINLDRKNLKIRYEGHEITYSKTHMPL